MTVLAGELAGLEHGLEGLLSILESAAAVDLEAAGTALARTEGAFMRLRAALEQAPEERAGCEPRVAHCLRLYAVALGQLDGLREALVRERALCSQARTRLTRLHEGSASGVSCDLSA